MPEAARSDIRDLCEDYSLLARQIDHLRRSKSVSMIGEYEELSRFLEEDVKERLGIIDDKVRPSSARSRLFVLDRLSAVANWARKLWRFSNELTSIEARTKQRIVD
ncbi:hypothetical protein B5K06_28015 [Rhizobium grahamii]|uniref:Uncharacterized protein n=1 Tax=Rhizobium grahamii TaxID=1120045 RepID=A0A370KG69_9HYPH|nr:hypothetical protein B5K06_28015 [Rhizobium grahamii]